MGLFSAGDEASRWTCDACGCDLPAPREYCRDCGTCSTCGGIGSHHTGRGDFTCRDCGGSGEAFPT